MDYTTKFSSYKTLQTKPVEKNSSDDLISNFGIKVNIEALPSSKFCHATGLEYPLQPQLFITIKKIMFYKSACSFTFSYWCGIDLSVTGYLLVIDVIFGIYEVNDMYGIGLMSWMNVSIWV